MKRFVAVLFVAAAVLALATPSQAVVTQTDLSLNCTSNGGLTPAYTGGGVLDPTSRTWDVYGGGYESINNLGTLSKTFGSVTVAVDHYRDAAQSITGGITLFDGYLYSGNATYPTTTYTLSGLDNSRTYDLAVYSAWNWGSLTVSWTVDATTKTTTGATKTSFVADDNYVIFSGLTPSAGTIILTSTSANSQVMLSGMELTSVAVPEPGVFALLATGLAGLLCYAWRKRR